MGIPTNLDQVEDQIEQYEDENEETTTEDSNEEVESPEEETTEETTEESKEESKEPEKVKEEPKPEFTVEQQEIISKLGKEFSTKMIKIGLDWNQIVDVYKTSGQLPNETYSAFEALGYSQFFVENQLIGYIHNETSVGRTNWNRIERKFGGNGKDSSRQAQLFMEYVEKVATQEQQDAINDALFNNTSFTALEMMLDKFYPNFQDDTDEPNLNHVPGTVKRKRDRPFKSPEEARLAISSEKYYRDPKHAAEMRRRYNATKRAGII